VPALLWGQHWEYKIGPEDGDHGFQLKKIMKGQCQGRVKHVKYHHRNGKE